MELSFENLKGTGWKAKIAKLNTKSNIDLVSLYDLNKERVVYQPVTIKPRVLIPKVIRGDNEKEAKDA